jgi:hypothetical protein
MRQPGRRHARYAVPAVSMMMTAMHRHRAPIRTHVGRSVRLGTKMRTALRRQSVLRVLLASTRLEGLRCAVHVWEAVQITTAMHRRHAYRAWLALLPRRATQVLALHARLGSMQQRPPARVRTAQLDRLMRTPTLLHRARAVWLAWLLREAMLANVTRAWLVSTLLRHHLCAPTALQARPTTTCRRIQLAPRVCRACTQSMGMLVSATAALLGVSIHRLAERAWMRARRAWLGRTRVLGRQHARSARVGLRTRTVTHRPTALHAPQVHTPDAARRSATSARPVRWTVT